MNRPEGNKGDGSADQGIIAHDHPALRMECGPVGVDELNAVSSAKAGEGGEDGVLMVKTTACCTKNSDLSMWMACRGDCQCLFEVCVVLIRRVDDIGASCL